MQYAKEDITFHSTFYYIEPIVLSNAL